MSRFPVRLATDADPRIVASHARGIERHREQVTEHDVDDELKRLVRHLELIQPELADDQEVGDEQQRSVDPARKGDRPVVAEHRHDEGEQHPEQCRQHDVHDPARPDARGPVHESALALDDRRDQSQWVSRPTVRHRIGEPHLRRPSGLAGMDMAAMNMGDADAAPADEIEGAALAKGDYQLLDTRPAGYDDVAGTAVIARSNRGTTVTTELTGLLPNEEYIAHLHAQACADDNAGAHYQFEVGGPTTPPNEIHLAFTSDSDGNGYMTAENEAIAGIDAEAFVVHPQDLIDNKVACVDFVEDEPGAALAAIEAGVS